MGDDYSWIKEFKRSWEHLETGEIKHQQKPRKERQTQLRPLLRNLVLVLDYSKAALKTDFKPTRHKLISQLAESFKADFYAHNPLSTLKFIVARNGKAYCISDTSELHMSAIGEFSLQNSLELALTLLEEAQLEWSSEIVVIHNSLSSCDPGNVWKSIEDTATKSIKVSVISLCAEVFLMKEATRRTQGKIFVVSDESELEEEWAQVSVSGKPVQFHSLVSMAFPRYSPDQSPCGCHLKVCAGYICPICYCKVCSLPSKCAICGFVLLATPHLAKAALSLSPLPLYPPASGTCIGCEDSASYMCPSCQVTYCSECEEFLRNSIGRCFNCGL